MRPKSMNEVVRIGNKEIGKGRPVFIVGEIGINHNGSKETARALIDIAADCKLDAVKVQSSKADEFLNPRDKNVFEFKKNGRRLRENVYDLFRRCELKWEWHKELFDYAQRKGLLFFSAQQSEKSADFLRDIGVPVFKIGSADLTYYQLIKYVADKELPLILSTGMSTLDEIDKAVKIVKSSGNKNLILLHCVSTYPAVAKDINLNAMEVLKKRFNVPIGYSDHTEGIAVATAAVALGACMIEKHITLDKSLPGPDHAFSTDPSELKILVESIRTAEAALGRRIKEPTEREKKTRLRARRSIVASRDIKKNETITLDKIAFKRPGLGLSPEQVSVVLGARAKRNIDEGILITPDLIGK